MSCTRSFIDVLFILLIGAIVMLSNSIQLGAVDAVPAKVDSEGIDTVDSQAVRIVIVRPEEVIFEGDSYSAPDAVIPQLLPGDQVLLVSGREELRHRRMMTVWSEFSRKGWSVQIGVEPNTTDGRDLNTDSKSFTKENEE